MIQPPENATEDPSISKRDGKELFSTAKGGGELIAGRLFNYFCRIVIAVLMARILGPERYGLYNLAITAATIAAAIAMFGLDTTLMRYIAIMNARKDERGLWGAIQVGLGTSLLLSTLAGVILFALAYPIANGIFHEPRLVPLLQISSLVVPFLTMSDVLAGATRGFKNMRDTVIAQNLIQPLVRLVIIGILALTRLTLPLVIIAFGLADMSASVVLLFFLNRRFGLNRSLSNAQRSYREILGFSFTLWLSDVMITFRSNLQTLLLGSLNSVRGVGLFSIANQVNLLGSIFHSSLTQSARPLVAELHDQGKRLQLGYLYQTATRWVVTLNLPFIIITALFPRQIITIFGKEFTDAAPALTVLAMVSLVNVSTGMCGAIIEMTGHARLRLLNSVVRVSLALFLNFLLIPRWGIMGAAVAALAHELASDLLPLFQIWMLYRLLPYNRTTLKPMAAGITAVVVALALRQVFPLNDSLTIAALHAAVVMGVYALMMQVLGLSSEERTMVARLRRRVNFILSRL